MHYTRDRFFKLVFLSVVFLGILFLALLAHISDEITKPILMRKPYFFDKSNFSYPLVGDVLDYVRQLRNGEEADVEPINSYNYPFRLYNQSKCLDSNGSLQEIDVLIVVKSAMKHSDRRDAIRQTWGGEKQFATYEIRTIFLLGINLKDKVLQEEIIKEHQVHGDLVQSDFVDTYFNNTIKTMQGISWVVKNCSLAEYVFFADDDMFVNVENLLMLIYYVYNISESDDLFVGKVIRGTPFRDKARKYYVSPKEYPYPYYPPFINAGAYILAYNTLEKLYYGSMFTKHFRLDDVYLGIVAIKCNISVRHSDLFLNKLGTFNKVKYRNIVAVHGFYQPQSLIDVWNLYTKH